tara:strand:- start:336 stop:647 length:312 start_codon:yes stop_codon:yes gene_type:complete
MSKSPFYKTGKPKIPKTGTTDFPTTESRKSNYKLKDLAKAGADIAMSAIPGGGILKAARIANKARKLRYAKDILDVSKKSSSVQKYMAKNLHKFDKSIKPPKK